MSIKLYDNKIEKFITSLEKSTTAKVLRTLDLLEQFGNQLGMPHSKSLKDGLFELRIRGVQEVRIIYAFHKKDVVLLHGFTKKTNKILSKDLKAALSKKNLLD